MKIAGTAVLHAPADRVWAALNDPAVLARTIPGCSALEPDGPDRYRMTVTAGVASIKGVYAGEVKLTDKQEPTRYVMHASGSGGPGSVRATVPITLEEVDAGDRTADDGQRMITGVAKRLAGQFFSAIDAELTGTAPAAETLYTNDFIDDSIKM